MRNKFELMMLRMYVPALIAYKAITSYVYYRTLLSLVQVSTRLTCN